MLYIFHVDTGATLTFDIKLALQSVSELKEAIERKCGIMAVHQVLLMNGGESLEPNARVCSYSAGTDTNPIYLFSKAAIESHVPPTPHTDYSNDVPDVSLVDRINASLVMSATYRTLVTRAELAQQCYELAREQTNACDHLVHDQHFQHQGWAAVVANLEDITQMFKSRADVLQQSFALYLTEREQHMQLLNNFNSDLGTLSKIPILPALRAQAEGLLSPEDQPSQDPQQQQVAECTSDDVLSLLKWISAKDNQSSLEQVAEQCSRGLEQFDERMMEALMSEVNAAIDAANKQEMKEIKGLGERLSALEQLMNQAKRLVQEQGELAQGFLQNQTRASNLGDPSVLPDLCASHRHQLVVMMENHSQLRDIRRRCTKAKEELSVNIYHRLKWIMYVENKMMEVDGKLVMYHESLKRLKRHLEVVQQIHLAPQMYMSAVAEVVRRRTFSQAFLVWASNLACQLLTVHSEEIARRREFQSKFDGHFLYTLFTGLEDTPPPYATQAPAIFDSGLPKLTIDDMESLKDQLPDLADSISTPDLNTITQFFLSKSLSDGSSDGTKEKDSISMPVDMPSKERRERLPMVGDRVGFESETDTEEFEKIGQGGGDSKLGSFDEAKQKLQKQLEENLGNTRSEVERLRSILRSMKIATSEAMTAFREELSILREKVTVDKTDLKDVTDRVRHALVVHSRKCEDTLRERERELTVDHELEMADMKKLLQSRDEEIRNMYGAVRDVETQLADREYLINTMRQKLESEHEEMRDLRTRLQRQLDEALEQARVDKETALKETNEARHAEIDALNRSLAQCQQNVRELEENLRKTRAEQQRAVKEATDKVQMEYKSELDTIRTRFKMVAMATSTMERSPSDSSLEKIERPDVIERANHEAILAKTKEDMEIEKDLAVREAIEKENSDFNAKLDLRLHLAAQQMGEETEAHRLRETALVEECQQYQEMIRRLTDEDISTRKVLTDKVEKLEEEKQRLENKMLAERIVLKQRESQVEELEAERNGLRQELNESRLKMSQSGAAGLEDALQTLLSGSSGGRDEQVEVSESKKVRLEASASPESLARRLELLELDNKRLTVELRVIRESKESIEAKVEALEADKVRLEIELVKERSRRGVVLAPDCGSYCGASIASTSDSREREMNASVAVVSESSSQPEYAACSEYGAGAARGDGMAHYRQLLAKYFHAIMDERHVTFATCNPGDIVLVDWDPVRSHYAVVQDARTLYILNSECVDTIELSLNPDGTPKATHILCRVLDKQYCHARKPENRYHVPQGTKFYRVRVKPLAYVP